MNGLCVLRKSGHERAALNTRLTHPCLDATDVLDALGWSSVVPSSQLAMGPALPDDAGSQAIVEALRDAPASRDELAQRLSLGDAPHDLRRRVLPHSRSLPAECGWISAWSFFGGVCAMR